MDLGTSSKENVLTEEDRETTEGIQSNSDAGDITTNPNVVKSGSPSLNQNGNCSEDSEDGENATASEISDLSDFSQEAWAPVQGPMAWVQDQMRQGQSPRKILGDLVPDGTSIPDGLDALMLWKIIINIISEPPKRKKLQHVNTLDDVLSLLKTCKKIMVLTGAGVSVSCGIPDFRSRDGVYARLAKDFPNLPDPQAMFDIHFFRNDPRPFFKFAKEIYPGQFQPSLCHKFIRVLEEKGKLLRNYTQNIDTLEQEAGIQQVVQCHGSFATATCTVCGHKVNSDAIKEDIFKQVIPHCPQCSPGLESAVMKPDIVFFGESLPEHFHHQMSLDKEECDLLIVIGSSLKVRPVALIPNSLPANVPQILINRERLHYLNFDVELLGDCDDIVADLCRRLGQDWHHLASSGRPLTEVSLDSLPTPPASPTPDLGPEGRDSPPLKFSSSLTSPPQMDGKEEKQSQSESGERPSTGNEASVSHNHHHHGHHHHHHGHHHNHHHKKGDPAASPSKRPFSSVSQGAGPSDQVDCSCSKETMDCIVTACHKIEVAHVPSDSEISPCHRHHHHGLHHHRSSESETGESSPKKARSEENSLDVEQSSSQEPHAMWQGKKRTSLAQRLEEGQVLFLPPSRYVFNGAEVFSDSDSEDDSDEEEEGCFEEVTEDKEPAQSSGADLETSQGQELLEMFGQESSEVPGEGSSEVSGQGSSEKVLAQGLSEVSGQGSSEKVLSQGSTEVSGQGSSEVACQGSSQEVLGQRSSEELLGQGSEVLG